MKTKTFFSLVILAGLLFAGCSKNNATPAKPKCYISSITGNVTSATITYNTDAKVSSITDNVGSDAYIYNYTYSSGTITETATDKIGTFIFKAVFTLDNSGLITRAIEYDNTSGSDWIKRVYEYNGNELAKLTQTSSSGSSYSNTYIWQNGNMVSVNNGDAFTYYTNKARMPGDGFDVFTIIDDEGIGDIAARREVINKNLLKSHGTTNYSYTFDTDGKVTSMTATDNSGTPTLYQYQYECP